MGQGLEVTEYAISQSLIKVNHHASYSSAPSPCRLQLAIAATHGSILPTLTFRIVTKALPSSSCVVAPHTERGFPCVTTHDLVLVFVD